MFGQTTHQESPGGLRPEKVSQPSKERIEIIWKDGHRSVYSGYDLRVACACAQCEDETSGIRRLQPELPDDLFEPRILAGSQTFPAFRAEQAVLGNV